MSPTRQARVVRTQFRVRRAAALAAACLAVLFGAPAAALAHGPVAPTATAFLARIHHVPAGIEAKIVDGYVRIWMRVPARDTVIVSDYEGAPYVRFTPSGVEVNHNSTMYYLNEVPQAATPPADLNAHTVPHWVKVSGGHSYEWHDGRLQGLAGVAIAPGERDLGGWKVPLIINGSAAAITGELDHTDAPSILWFWPILVLLACTAAAFRLRDPELDRRLLTAIGGLTLAAIGVAAVARGLHGRPDLSAFSVVEMFVVFAICAWAFGQLLARSGSVLVSFVIAFVAIWEGLNLLTALLRNYVLLALPAFPSRAAATLCLGGGLSLLLLASRLAGGRPGAGAGSAPAEDAVPDGATSPVG